MSEDPPETGSVGEHPTALVEMLGPLRVSLLAPAGSEEAEALDPLGAKPTAILAFLLTRKGPVERMELARMFWPDSPEERARHSLREALRRIRRAAGGDPFLSADPVEIDVARFAIDVDLCRETLKQGDLDSAVSLWRGPFLQDITLEGCWAFEEWKEHQRQVLAAEVASALHSRAIGSAPTRDPAEILRDHLDAVRTQPSRGLFWADAVRIVTDFDALEAAEELLEMATSESPEEHVDDLRDWLSRRRQTQGQSALPAIRIVGRDAEQRILRANLRRTLRGHGSVTAVVGPPGMGKTTLLDWTSAESRRWPSLEYLTFSPKAADHLLSWSSATGMLQELLELPGASGTSPGSDEILALLRPSLKRRNGSSGLNGSLDPRIYEAAFADAFRDLLGAIGSESPLVILLDDVHLMDTESQELLVRLSRDIDRLPVVMVLAVDLLRAAASVRTLLQGPALKSSLAVLELGPLSDDDLDALLPDLDDESVRMGIRRASGGMPGVAMDLAANGTVSEKRTLAWRYHLKAQPDLQAPSLTVPPALQGVLESERARRLGSGDGGVAATGWRRGWAWKASLASMVLLVVLAVIARALAPPPFGGGEVYVYFSDQKLEVYSVRDGRWREVSAPPVPLGPRITGPFRTVAGDDFWVETTADPNHSPDVYQLLPWGERKLISAFPGDDSFLGFSPDGRYALVLTENMETPEFDRDLVVVRLYDGNSWRVFRSSHGMGHAEWSRDGTRILFSEAGRGGEILVLSPSGGILERHGSAHNWSGQFCGPENRILRVVNPEGTYRVSLLDETGDWRLLLEHLALRVGPCSPDGSVFLAWVAREGRWNMEFISTEDGSTVRVLTGANRNSPRFVAWYPPSESPVPVQVEVATEDHEVDWGGRGLFRARTLLSDGNYGSALPVEWRSSDPLVASVTPRGEFTGNRPGAAWITGTVAGWLSDSVQVRVRGGPPPALLLYDSFPAIDAQRWTGVGSPTPIVEESRWEGRPTLHMNGDGMWTDGLLSLESFRLPRGGRLGVEFRMPLTREDRQKITLCFVPERAVSSHPEQPARATYLGQSACLNYPSGEVVDFSDRSPEIQLPQWTWRVPPADPLPTDDWIHLSLVMQPDGSLWAEVNGVPTEESPLRFPEPMPDIWRVAVFGKDVDTRLEVMSLALWDGVDGGEGPGS